jgi:hypothetical protein
MSWKRRSILGNEPASFATELLDAMFQIPRVTSHFMNQERGQGLTHLEGVFAILFLGVHYPEVLDSTSNGAQPQCRYGWTAACRLVPALEQLIAADHL